MRLLCALVAATLPFAFQLNASAQTIVPGSNIAGVTFPEPANLWVTDAARSQATAIAQAAVAAGRTCGSSEFHIWYVVGGAQDGIQSGVDAAFAQAGWSLTTVDAAADGRRTYLASRSNSEVVMAWLPQSEAIGLVLCAVTGTAAAVTPNGEAVPVPLPRPDPIAEVIAQTPPRADAGAVPEPAVPEPAAPAAEAPAVAEPPAIVDNPPPAVAQAEPVVPASAPAPEPVAAAESPASDGGASLGLLMVGALLACTAVIVFRWAFVGAHRAIGSSWPTVPAKVVYANVATEARPGKRKGQRFVPVVAYEYVVDGILYRAARLRFADSSQPTADAAWDIADRFPVGSAIDIRYDPQSPVEATIEATANPLRTRLVIGGVFAVLAAAALILALT